MGNVMGDLFFTRNLARYGRYSPVVEKLLKLKFL
jgi:hypothetical protein